MGSREQCMGLGKWRLGCWTLWAWFSFVMLSAPPILSRLSYKNKGEKGLQGLLEAAEG